MSGDGHAALGAVRVVDDVDAGGNGLLEGGGGAVQLLEHLGRVEPELGEGTGRGAQLSHAGGRVDAAAHDVPDDEDGGVVGPRDGVEPVPADLAAGRGGPVPGGDFQAGRGRWVVGQEVVLEREGCVVRVAVPAGVVDAHGGAGGEFGRPARCRRR